MKPEQQPAGQSCEDQSSDQLANQRGPIGLCKPKPTTDHLEIDAELAEGIAKRQAKPATGEWTVEEDGEWCALQSPTHGNFLFPRSEVSQVKSVADCINAALAAERETAVTEFISKSNYGAMILENQQLRSQLAVASLHSKKQENINDNLYLKLAAAQAAITTGEWTLVPRALHFNIKCDDDTIYEGVTSEKQGRHLVTEINASLAAEREKREKAEQAANHNADISDSIVRASQQVEQQLREQLATAVEALKVIEIGHGVDARTARAASAEIGGK